MSYMSLCFIAAVCIFHHNTHKVIRQIFSLSYDQAPFNHNIMRVFLFYSNLPICKEFTVLAINRDTGLFVDVTMQLGPIDFKSIISMLIILQQC